MRKPPVKKLATYAAWAMLFVVTFNSNAWAQVSPQGAPRPIQRDLTAKIDAYIQPFVASNNFPGAILVAQGDTILFDKAYGMANYELHVPNTTQSRFHIGSLTKMFTAAAVLLLEEQGKLKTSDTVSKFLPDYPNGDKIVIEQLLTHTAGVPNVDFSEGDRRTHFTTEKLVARFKDRPLDFAPGARTR